MIPLRDHSPPAAFPLVTYVLIAANAAVFLYMVSLPSGLLESFVETYALQPTEVSGGNSLSTLLTSMFLHGGYAHIIGNMMFLHIFGDNLEGALGKLRFLIYYLLSGLGGSVLQILTDPASPIPNLGASGAISGILAGYLSLFPQHRVDVLFTFGWVWQRSTVPAYSMIIYWFIVQFFSGIGSIGAVDPHEGGVAYFAHIGGFVAGWILLRIMYRGGQREL